MCNKALNTLKVSQFLCISLFIMVANIAAQDDFTDFESDRWTLVNADITEYLNRKCLSGTAYLKDVEFENGVIEVDIAVDGSRSYPGIIFRMQDQENAERFYIRPHRAGLYTDALQYTPIINGDSPWQLYHGEGFTAPATIPENQWVHVKMEISGSQAKVFLNNAEKPSLVIHELKHGVSKGTLGLMGPKNKSAFYSNFRYRIDNGLEFEAPPKAVETPNALKDWEISRVFPAAQLNIEELNYPSFFTIFSANWQRVIPEPSGLVDIARYAKRSGQAQDCVLARTIIRSDEKQTIKLSFGYSDEVSIFLNGKKVYYGNSSYQKRDRSFLGIVGYYDVVYLDLEKGLNEILLMVKETFGGWGFMFKADRELKSPVKDNSRLTKVWETPADFMIPESVLYDPDNKVLYVSSFNRAVAANANKGFISKVKLNGEIEELNWVTGLDGPCGMGQYQGKLYVVECSGNLVEIDKNTGTIANKYPIPNSRFLNDLVVDSEGNIYISDTSPPLGITSVIYRFKDGIIEEWKGGDEIYRANGLFIHDNKLIVGNTGDGFLKTIDLDTRIINNVVCLGAGVIDGIRVDNKGNYLVSHWEGQTFSITPSGDITEILDIMKEGLNIADYEFIKDQNLLIIPTFLANKVVAYRLREN